MYNVMIFSKLTKLCSDHTHPFLEHFYHCSQIPGAHLWLITLPIPSSWQPLIYILSLYAFSGHLCKWSHTISGLCVHYLLHVF